MNTVTVKELIATGYREYNSVWHKGYVSRKINTNEINAVAITKGKHNGMYYALFPSFESTKYCRKVYFYKPQ